MVHGAVLWLINGAKKTQEADSKVAVRGKQATELSEILDNWYTGQLLLLNKVPLTHGKDKCSC